MKKITLILAGCIMVLVSVAQPADSIRKHIDTALNFLQAESYYSKNINWTSLRKQVYEAAANANNKAATYTALSIAFRKLNDPHATFYHYDSTFHLPDTTLPNRYTDSLKAEWGRGVRVKAEMIGNIAYISIPTLTGSQQQTIDKYATWIYNGVAKLAIQHPQGWVIDLRLNAGGNIRPMMGGLVAFFNNGLLSYYINNKKQLLEPSAIQNGRFYISNVQQAFVPNDTLSILANAKVAVIIGPGTASSGEILAHYFKQRTNTHVFGEATAGVANSTGGISFAADNVYFLITTAALTDAHKKPLPFTVQPHVTVHHNDHFSQLTTDNAFMQAVHWLQQ